MKRTIITQERFQLIDTIVFRVAVHGAFQRNQIYCTKLNSVDAKAFKLFLKKSLEEILEKITLKKIYSDSDHYKFIDNFAKKISKEYHWCLRNGKMNIGTAQKLLNLYWKMKWILSRDVAPPIHCPFDGVIIRTLDRNVRHFKWTQIEHISKYKMLVKSARMVSNRKSLAEWELITYNSGNSISID